MRAILTEQQAAEAKALYDSGARITDIGRRYGLLYESIRRVVDPAYRARRQAKVNECRRAWTAKNAVNREGSGERKTAEYLVTKADGAARLAEIPDDTRDLTARFFGDPLPGRRAIDMRGRA